MKTAAQSKGATCEGANPAGEKEATGDVCWVAQLSYKRALQQPPELCPPTA